MDKEKLIRNLKALLRGYDWYYAFSDDQRVYKAGEQESRRILALVSQLGEEGTKIYNSAAPEKMKLTEKLTAGKESIVRGMKGSKRDLVKRYGKDAEKVMYGRAEKLTTEGLRKQIREIIKEELDDMYTSTPTWGNLNKSSPKEESGLIKKVDEDGNILYFNSKGELHRLDGPAIEYTNGEKFWYQNGKRHRLDGPAIEDSDGSKYWFINNQQYTKKEFNKEIQRLKAQGKI